MAERMRTVIVRQPDNCSAGVWLGTAGAETSQVILKGSTHTERGQVLWDGKMGGIIGIMWGRHREGKARESTGTQRGRWWSAGPRTGL